MTKKLLALAIAAIIGLNLSAQIVQETTTQVGMLKVPASTLTIEKDFKMTQNALVQYLKDYKIKPVKEQGFYLAADQLIPEIAAAPINLYAKAEEQGSKKNRSVVVTMCAISADLTIDQALMHQRVGEFLQGFTDYIVRYEASINMQAEEKELKKAEKSAAAAVKEMENIEKTIEKNTKKIESKRDEIEKLQGKIKSLEKEIADLEKENQKANDKKASAEQKINEKQSDVNARQDEVERYRKMSE